MSEEKINLPRHAEVEREEAVALLCKIDDPVLMVLRMHLYTEYLLERLIACKLKRGDRLLDHGSLSYHQKLQVVASFDYVLDAYITALGHLNKLRNQFSHELHRSISFADVDKIGRPLGGRYTKLKRESRDDIVETTRRLFTGICGGLYAYLEKLEDQQHVDVNHEKKK